MSNPAALEFIRVELLDHLRREMPHAHVRAHWHGGDLMITAERVPRLSWTRRYNGCDWIMRVPDDIHDQPLKIIARAMVKAASIAIVDFWDAQPHGASLN